MYLFRQGKGFGELQSVKGRLGLRRQVFIRLGHDLRLQGLPKGLVMYLFRQSKGFGEL